MIVAGIGCRRGCSAEEIEKLVRIALERAERPVSALRALAGPAFKAEEAGLRRAADAFGLPLIFMDAQALKAAQPRCLTRSEIARLVTGQSSVAEAAALAAAGRGSRLILPRLASPSATCALAEGAAS